MEPFHENGRPHMGRMPLEKEEEKSTILGNLLKMGVSNAVLFVLAFLIMFTFGGFGNFPLFIGSSEPLAAAPLHKRFTE